MRTPRRSSVKFSLVRPTLLGALFALTVAAVGCRPTRGSQADDVARSSPAVDASASSKPARAPVPTAAPVVEVAEYVEIEPDSTAWLTTPAPAVPKSVAELGKLPKAERDRLELLLCAGHAPSLADLELAVSKASGGGEGKDKVASGYGKLVSGIWCTSLLCGWAKRTLERGPGAALERVAWTALAGCHDPRLASFFEQRRAPAAIFRKWKDRLDGPSEVGPAEAAREYDKCMSASAEAWDKRRCLNALARADRAKASEIARRSPDAFGDSASALELVTALIRYPALASLEARLAALDLSLDGPSASHTDDLTSAAAVLASRGKVAAIVDDVTSLEDALTHMAAYAGLDDAFFSAQWVPTEPSGEGHWRLRARRGTDAFVSSTTAYGFGASMDAVRFFNAVARRIGSAQRAITLDFDDGTETMFVLIGRESSLRALCTEGLLACNRSERPSLPRAPSTARAN